MRYRAFTLDEDGDPEYLIYVADEDKRDALFERCRSVTFAGGQRQVQTKTGERSIDLSRLLVVDSVSGIKSTFKDGAIVYGAVLSDGINLRDGMH